MHGNPGMNKTQYLIFQQGDGEKCMTMRIKEIQRKYSRKFRKEGWIPAIYQVNSMGPGAMSEIKYWLHQESS